MECPSCGSANPEGKKFCGDCGAPLPVRCAGCGAENPPGKKFCGDCGAELASTPTTPRFAPHSVLPTALSASVERRQLTVLFADLVGSTALASRLDPEDLREVIGTYHHCVSETVGRFDGFVAKYMGDGVLVYFGYPQAHEDDPERAVRAGLSLIDSVGQLPGPERLQLRIGIDTGEVVVGDLIGSGDAQERGIVGETPNLAARLQALAQPNSVVIGSRTRRLLGALFEYDSLGAVEVKGFAEPVTAWRVLRPSRVESRFEALRSDAALLALVGRGEELDLLLRRWTRAKSGEGQVGLLMAEPGVGKSRLAAAVLERLQREPHIRLRYFCAPHHRDSALHPIISHLERAAGFDREDTPETKLDKLEALLGADLTPLEDISLLAELLALPSNRYSPATLSAQAKKERTLQALVRQVTNLSRRRPVAIVFEDAHWIDPTSLELLQMMVDRIQHLPVLLLVTFRPEFQPPWIGQPHVSVLALGRLNRGDAVALVKRVAERKGLADEIVQEIVDRTDGVPLFVEEMTKAVLEASTNSWSIDHTLSTASVVAVPASLHASLMARLDRLGPTAKRVAQIGAAIGREFSYALLRAVAGPQDHALDEGVAALTGAQLWFQRGTARDASLSFKHALVQDAAYSTLLRGPRQQLHATIAQVLQQQFPERADAQPELVAHHSTEGRLPEQAILYWLKAGRRSAERSADREAVRQLRRGLEVLMALPASIERDRSELEFQLALGTPLISLHGWSGEPVAAAYERASMLCERLDDAERLSPTLFGLASNRIVRGETRAAQELAGQLHIMARRSGDPVSELLAHRAMGAATMQLGEFAQARSEFARIGALYDPGRHRSLAARCVTDPRASAWSFLSLVLWIMGYPEQAQRRAEEAFRCTAELGHANTTGHILCHAGAELAQFLHRPSVAHAHADAAVALAAEHHMPMWRGYGTILRGWALTQEGCGQAGASLVRQGIDDLAALGTVFHRSLHLGILATIHAQLHDPTTGLQVLADAYEEVRRTEVYFWEAELHRIEGELSCLEGAPDAKVEACFADALALSRRQQAKSLELRAAMSLARLRGKQQRFGEGCAILEPVYGWFTEGFETHDLEAAKTTLHELRRA